jgi:PKD repeat protein
MMRHALSRLLIGAALLAGCAALPLAPASAVAQQAKPEYPKFSIPNPSPNIPDQSGPSGSAAWGILQPYLPQIQAWYGLTAKQLSDGFNQPRDRSIDQGEWRLANDGRIVIKEKIVPYRFSTDQRYSVWQPGLAFNLQSNPNAKIKIWLAYKTYDSASPGVIPTNEFSDDDKRRLTLIWQRVAEDFAPFDVNVTTYKSPFLNELERSSPTDNEYGVVVSIDNDPSNPPFAEGSVYLNSFDDLDETRRKITVKFPTNAQDPATMAHMISHLLGHSLGLTDENGETSLSSPFSGFDTPTGTWAPIMGRPGNAQIRQFSRGEFRRSPAPNQIDSISRIAKVLPIRTDDVGDTIQKAAPMSFYPLCCRYAVAEGVIERRGDKDVYVLNMGAGRTSLWAGLRNGSVQNANMQLTLFDRNGIEIANTDVNAGLGVSNYLDVPRAGTYYLQVSAAGSGDLQRGGYSDYGSLGNYEVSAQFQPFQGYALQAILSATPKTGPAPLTVQLDASQSRDDQEVKFIYWDFGDGTTNETGTVRKYWMRYDKPGTYKVSIRVVDDTGQSATTTETITVTGAGQKVVSARVDLGLINMSKTSSAAFGTLYVVDGNGKRLQNASVRYTWSGLHQGQRSVISQTLGSPVMSLASSQKGCFNLTVTGITLAGFTFDANAPSTFQACR